MKKNIQDNQVQICRVMQEYKEDLIHIHELYQNMIVLNN
jgi:hypothetical protein